MSLKDKWTEVLASRTHSFTWVLAEGLSSSASGPVLWASWLSSKHGMAAGFFHPREWKAETTVSFWPNLEVMHSHLCRFLKSSQEDMFIDFGEREKRCVASIMCPDWGSNPQPFGVWDDAATNWATQQGHLCHVLVTSQTNQDTLREGIWYHMDISRQDHWGPSCMLVTTASFYM